MPCTTLSWWLLVPKVTEEIVSQSSQWFCSHSFDATGEGGAGWLFMALPCCTGLCEGAVVGKTEQWHHCTQQAVLTGWFSREKWTEPAYVWHPTKTCTSVLSQCWEMPRWICSKEASQAGRASPPTGTGQEVLMPCKALGALWAPRGRAQAVSRGVGCPGRRWLVCCWKYSTKQVRGIYWEQWLLS